MQVFLLYALVVLIWGSTWAAIPYQLGDVAAELSVAYRFGIAALAIYAYALLSGRRLRLPLDADMHAIHDDHEAFGIAFHAAQEGVVEAELANALLVVGHTLIPELAGPGVMTAKRMVHRPLQTRGGSELLQALTRRQHAAGKYVHLDEVRLFAVALQTRVIDHDHLQHGAPAGLERFGQGGKVAGPVRFAHRFQHFDGHDVIVPVLHVAVVLQTQFDPAR